MFILFLNLIKSTLALNPLIYLCYTSFNKETINNGKEIV